MSLSIGSPIGPYEIQAPLGAGGMGEVYAARDTRLDRLVAIKIVPESLARRFELEGRALASLNHPNICTVHDVGTNYLVMELVGGETLRERLRRGPLPLADALRHAAQIADALGAAHAHGIVHRDLKPGNIMVTDTGVKVLDFGIAKYTRPVDENAETATSGLTEAAITARGQIVGTPAYMSPEQAEGKPVDARSDIFAFGIVLYEMVCGQIPFRGDTTLAALASTLQGTPEPPSHLRREVPRPLERLILRCLEKNPDARFSSGEELRKAFAELERSTRVASISVPRASVIALAVVIVVGAGVFLWRSYQTTSRARWVEQAAVPEITRLLEADRTLEARRLFRQAEQYARESRSLFKLAEGVATAHAVAFETEPPGAQIYISDYAAGAGDDLSGWQALGEAPVKFDQIPNWGFFRVRAIKSGFAPSDQTFANNGSTADLTVRIVLNAEKTVPRGMVLVPATTATRTAPSVALPAVWMDRHEVTNGEFKKFVAAGAYLKPEYWKHPFVKDGKRLSWREAMAEFRDTTGRPGPATWQIGNHPDGSEQLPVGGVSWYEAAAYAEFSGKSLPSVHEWVHAAGIGVNSNIVQLSNFNGKGAAPQRTFLGMSPFGTYDMAGNLKEWTMNDSGDAQRYILGGAWNEPAYVFYARDARAPFARDETFGFRCVMRISPIPDAAAGTISRSPQGVRGPPVPDETYRVFLDLHAYDKQPLDARVERRDESSPYWRRETVSFKAAYGSERMLAHVFLPKNSRPPYQTVVMMGGSTITDLKRVEDFDYPYEFVIRSGRALIIPVFAGTLERGPTPSLLPPRQERERGLKWSMDFGRTIDYLETRPDMDVRKLAFYGVSMAPAHGVRFAAVDSRVKTAVLSSGGLPASRPAEIDVWNYAPRVRIPVLMVNGRHDFIFPLETSQKPLFQALGTREPDKRHILYDGGHRNLVTRPDLIGEILDWLDKYLGPVNPT